MPYLDADACARLFEIGSRGDERFREPGEFFECVITDIYAGVLSLGDTALDGGAHVGRHTLPMAQAVGESGLVLAIEPLPDLARKLERKARKQRIGQIQVIAKALHDRIARIPFHWVKAHAAYSGIERRRYDFEEKVRVVEVETTTIDALLLSRGLRRGGRWRFCKLDLEGGELRALQGGISGLGAHRPMIVFENDQELSASYYHYSKEDWFSFFESLGYDVFTLWGHPYMRGDWGRRDIPWYFIAAAVGSPDVAFVANELPGLLAKYL
ncbi:MAG TPA: FkbM family methyltransferase [Rhizomicrobium sp.]|jgi:FkbM family methyltransferase